MLSARSDRRARSKSPGGGRDWDPPPPSRDPRPRSPPKEYRRPSKRYSSPSSDSESAEDPRAYEKKPSKKAYEPDSEDDRRRRPTKGPKEYSDSESEESDRYKKSSKGTRTYEAVKNDDRERRDRKEQKPPVRKYDDSESDSDSHNTKESKALVIRKRDSESESGSEDVPAPAHRKSQSSAPVRPRKENEREPERRTSYAPPAPPPPAPSYGYPQPGYMADPRINNHDTRSMSYAEPRDARYAAPPPSGAYPLGHSDVPDHSRVHSISAPRGQRYAETEKYQYAQPDPSITYKYTNDRDKQYARAPPTQPTPAYSRDPYQQTVTVKPRTRDERREKKDEKKNGDDRYESREKREEKKYDDDRYEPREKREERKYNDDRYAQPEKREKKYDDDKYERSVKKEEKKYNDDKHEKREKKYQDDKYGSPSEGLEKKVNHLTIGGLLGAAGATGTGSRQNSADAGRPPASPLLEAYKGTYQSISPMPSPLVIADHRNDSDLSDLDLPEASIADNDPNADLKRQLYKIEREKKGREKVSVKEKERDKENRSEKETEHIREIQPRQLELYKDEGPMTVISPTTRKRVSFYDPSDDARKIAAALQGTHHAPNTKPLIAILPGLSTDEIFALRTEYKNHAKLAGQGINMAKHIKMRVGGNLGKAAYATALGRWESEAYWANSWYQGGASRRELLIESLMGRSNSDIREIKNCFKDKRYGDDLERCMKAELKADKFRLAILLALEERRMADSVALDIATVNRDVADLYRALTGREGGETAMIHIIVVRSDAHLREVLRMFEMTYNRNFAREMISKSRNLVGETLAHILNGALNRPMRDALLLHQAVSETAPGKERAELLISRLVRLHWEPRHLERVKSEYLKRYKVPIDVAIKREVVDVAKTEEGKQWGIFCIELVRSCSK